MEGGGRLRRPVGTRPALLAAAALALTWPALACGGATATPSAPVVKSTDGLAQLTVPSGALPDGVALSSVKIVRVPITAAGPAGPIAAYQFQPDGLQFRQPATFSVTLPGASGVVPLLTLVSKNGLDASLANAKVDILLDRKQTVETVPIAHFSQLSVAYGFFSVHMTDPGVQQVRATFPVTVDVTRTATSGHVATALTDDGSTLTVPTVRVGNGPPLAAFIKLRSDNFSLIQGNFSTSGPISPNKVGDAPARQASSGGTVTYTQRFQCVSAGSGVIAHDAYIEFDQEIDTFVWSNSMGPDFQPPASTLTPEPSKTGITKQNYTIRSAVTCQSNPTPTSTPPPTPTPTATPTPHYPGPIQAVFDEAAFTTIYTEPEKDPSWTYAWTLQMQADAPCAAGFKGNAPAANQATWYHADTTQGGPCDHNSYGPSGHPGQVTLVVTGPGFRCQAQYFGTLTGASTPPQCIRT